MVRKTRLQGSEAASRDESHLRRSKRRPAPGQDARKAPFEAGECMLSPIVPRRIRLDAAATPETAPDAQFCSTDLVGRTLAPGRDLSNSPTRRLSQRSQLRASPGSARYPLQELSAFTFPSQLANEPPSAKKEPPALVSAAAASSLALDDYDPFGFAAANARMRELREQLGRRTAARSLVAATALVPQSGADNPLSPKDSSNDETLLKKPPGRTLRPRPARKRQEPQSPAEDEHNPTEPQGQAAQSTADELLSPGKIFERHLNLLENWDGVPAPKRRRGGAWRTFKRR